MRFIGILAVFLAVFVTVSAQAETIRVEKGARFGSWTVSCEAIAVNETLCVLSQRLVRSDSGNVLAELIAFNADDAPGSWLVARVPNGVYFPSGFILAEQEGETQLAFEWQACTPDICEAMLALEATEFDELAQAENWVAGYRPDMTSDALLFRIGVDGLEEGLTALGQALGQPGPRGPDEEAAP